MRREGINLTVDSTNTMEYFKAAALSYATIVFCQFMNILQRRSERTSLFNRNFFDNRILLMSIVISIGLVCLAIYGPGIGVFLAFGPIGVTDWIYILGAAGVYLAVFEILKLSKRLKAGGAADGPRGGRLPESV